jgi:uncharacterized protein (DUF2132 family)
VNNPLHGMTLEKLLIRLVDYYGWDGLFDMLQLQCFYNDPSIQLEVPAQEPLGADKAGEYLPGP